jgi:hypothetical protein
MYILCDPMSICVFPDLQTKKSCDAPARGTSFHINKELFRADKLYAYTQTDASAYVRMCNETSMSTQERFRFFALTKFKIRRERTHT